MNGDCYNSHIDLLPGDEGLEECDDSVGDKWRCLNCGKDLDYSNGLMHESPSSSQKVKP